MNDIASQDEKFYAVSNMATIPVAITITTLLLIQSGGGSEQDSSATPSHRYSQE
jgi:hypothetical protein